MNTLVWRDIENFKIETRKSPMLFFLSQGNEKTTFYFSMSQSYEKAHWQTYNEYQETVSTTFGHEPTRNTPSDFLRKTFHPKS